MTERVAALEGVRVDEDGVVVIGDVFFEVAAGEMVGIVGPSGSGKTTLLNVLLGLRAVDAGTVAAPSLGGDRGWRDVAFVPQALGLVPELTVADNVRLPLVLSRRTADDEAGVLASLALVHLCARRASEISLGEQQRVAVARALVCGAGLVVADEPTAHQDAVNAERVASALASAARAGRAVVVATHDVALSAACTRLVTLHAGRVVR
ncbi:MAG TPA: ATP-binding cassette domain-containing protein [Acidimicrobiales bacterium]